MIWRYVSVHGEGITFSVRTWLGHEIHSTDLLALGLDQNLTVSALSREAAEQTAGIIDRAMSKNYSSRPTRYKRGGHV